MPSKEEEKIILYKYLAKEWKNDGVPRFPVKIDQMWSEYMLTKPNSLKIERIECLFSKNNKTNKKNNNSKNSERSIERPNHLFFLWEGTYKKLIGTYIAVRVLYLTYQSYYNYYTYICTYYTCTSTRTSHTTSAKLLLCCDALLC